MTPENQIMNDVTQAKAVISSLDAENWQEAIQKISKLTHEYKVLVGRTVAIRMTNALIQKKEKPDDINSNIETLRSVNAISDEVMKEVQAMLAKSSTKDEAEAESAIAAKTHASTLVNSERVQDPLWLKELQWMEIVEGEKTIETLEEGPEKEDAKVHLAAATELVKHVDAANRSGDGSLAIAFMDALKISKYFEEAFVSGLQQYLKSSATNFSMPKPVFTYVPQKTKKGKLIKIPETEKLSLPPVPISKNDQHEPRQDNPRSPTPQDITSKSKKMATKVVEFGEKNMNKPMTFAEILREVWSKEDEHREYLVHTYICTIRQTGKSVVAIVGKGYMFVDDPRIPPAISNTIKYDQYILLRSLLDQNNQSLLWEDIRNLVLKNIKNGWIRSRETSGLEKIASNSLINLHTALGMHGAIKCTYANENTDCKEITRVTLEFWNPAPDPENPNEQLLTLREELDALYQVKKMTKTERRILHAKQKRSSPPTPPLTPAEAEIIPPTKIEEILPTPVPIPENIHLSTESSTSHLPEHAEKIKRELLGNKNVKLTDEEEQVLNRLCAFSPTVLNHSEISDETKIPTESVESIMDSLMQKVGNIGGSMTLQCLTKQQDLRISKTWGIFPKAAENQSIKTESELAPALTKLNEILQWQFPRAKDKPPHVIPTATELLNDRDPCLPPQDIELTDAEAIVLFELCLHDGGSVSQVALEQKTWMRSHEVLAVINSLIHKMQEHGCRRKLTQHVDNTVAHTPRTTDLWYFSR